MSSVSKHSAILIGAYFITAILNYGFGVGLSWLFPPAQYGILGVAQSLLLLLALAVGSGFTWTTANDLASGGVNESTRQRFRTSLVANTVIGIALGLGVWLAYRSGLLALGKDYRWIVPWIGVTLILLAIRSVVNGAARGMYLFSPVAKNLVLEVVVKVFLGLALVWAGLGAAGVVFAFAVGAGLSLVHSLWITRSARLFQGRWVFSPTVLKATAPLFVGMLGTALMLNLDILGLKLLSKTDGDTLAGLYQAAAILARTPVFLAQALTIVLFSYASSKIEPEANPPVRRVIYEHTALKAWWRLLLPAGVALILAPQAFLNLLFPAAYQDAAAVLQIAGAGGILLALSTLLIGVFQAQGKRRQPALAAGVAVLAQILTLFITVPRLGSLGAAISLLVAGIVSFCGLLPLLLPLHFTKSWQSILRKTAPITIFAILLVLLPHDDRVLASLKFSAAGLLYLLALSWVHPNRSASKEEQAATPALRLFTHFVQVLLGG